MVIDSDMDVQWTSEVKNIYIYVYHEFQVAQETLVEAQKKLESFIDSFWNSSTQNAILEKIVLLGWCSAIDVLGNCIKAFDKNISLIHRGLDLFDILMYLSIGSVDELLLEIIEKVVELFISVQIETEDQMEDIQKIMKKLDSLSPQDEG